jgi:hypothetical protein
VGVVGVVVGVVVVAVREATPIGVRPMVALVCAVWQQLCVVCLIGVWWARCVGGCAAAAFHGLSQALVDAHRPCVLRSDIV